MKFTRLRIAGFKTFVDPTEFLIEPGLTAVVGPNGCGKSNLVEALRWAMGESSHKSLRASGMDDVIFSGSGKRPSRNSAEVTITLDNSSRLAPAQFNDADTLEVSRRIERESGSSYKINGRDVRARDVQLLFADASTGAHSPSLVRQGQIGELISAKPQERRKILEEAAGIAGLHTRRHEAELRLRGAEQNLERLNDVLAEIETRLDSLKRQARQAQRFRQMSAEIRRVEALLMHLRWQDGEARIGERVDALTAITARVAEESQAVAALETARAQAASALPELRDNEVRAAAALRQLMVTRDGLDSERQRIVARQQELASRIEQARSDMERENRSIVSVDETLTSLVEESTRLEAEIAGATQKAEKCESRFGETERDLQGVETSLAQLTAEQAEQAARRGQIERTLREEGQRMERLTAQLADVRSEMESLSKDNDKADKLAALEEQVESARRAVEQADRDASSAQDALEAARTAESEAKVPVREAESHVQALRTEHKTLSGMFGQSDDLWAPLIESVEADQGYEAALGAVLGDDLEHPSDSGAPIHWTNAGATIDGDPSLPEGSDALSAHVRGPALLRRRLAQIGIVADRDQGNALQAKLHPGQRLVTLAGDVWRWDGLVAAADAPGAAARRLEQRNRIAELEGLISTAEAEAETFRVRAENALAHTATCAEAELRAREALKAAQGALDTAQREYSQLQKDTAQDTARLSALSEAETRLDHSLRESTAVRDESAQALDELGDSAALTGKIEETRAKVAQARAAYAEARAARDGQANLLTAHRRRVEEITRDRQRWDTQKSGAREQITNLQTRIETLGKEAEEIATAPDQIDHKRREIDTQIEGAEATRKQAADSLAEAETRLSEAERQLKTAETKAGETRELKAREEATVEGLRQRQVELAAEIRESLECAPTAILQNAGIAEDEAIPHADQLERKYEKLKSDRERLGGVNLRAEDEAREEQERFDALVSERTDLDEAVARLRGAIGSLNREGRERLVAAFDTVNGHFQSLFTKLFAGGSAELKFTESDDPLEAGLEIYARPPGKRPTTLTLLSGGEQALTAIALIFAVFLTNPAPICVLDEVDAPLDDANVERFCQLLEEMTRLTETRFVVITHNPITMSRMNRLFGVTMAERGISQLVSVDLVGAEQLREAG